MSRRWIQSFLEAHAAELDAARNTQLASTRANAACTTTACHAQPTTTPAATTTSTHARAAVANAARRSADGNDAPFDRSRANAAPQCGT